MSDVVPDDMLDLYMRGGRGPGVTAPDDISSMARELLRLRASAVADEAARKVAEAASKWTASRSMGVDRYAAHWSSEAGAVERSDIDRAVREYRAALAATRAGNETNQAGEGDAVAQTSGGVPFDSARPSPAAYPYKPQDGGSGSLNCEPSPATSTAEATAEERAAHVMRAWRDQSSSLRDLETIIGMEIRWLMDALASADRERRGEVAARERALAERDKARAQLHANYGHATRLLLERDAARAKLANDRAAQPARQPAASGEDIALVQRLAADLWHQDFCPWPKFNGDGVSREGECCCDFVEVERRVQEWLAKRLDRFLAARAAAGVRP